MGERGPDQRASAVRLQVGLLIALTAIAYCRVGSLEFVSIDDPAYVTDNPHVLDGVTLNGLRWLIAGVQSANWHPLTWLSHMIDVQLFGLSPLGHHLANLALHTANVILLFLLLRRLTGRDWPSLVVAALFAVHPLHVESVAWIAERKDVLSTCLFLLTLHAYANYTTRPGKLGYAVVAAGLALGLAAKPMLVSLPLVMLMLDYWPLGRGVNWSLVREKILLFALSLASCIITFIAQRQGGAIGDFEQFPLGARLANAAVAYAHYLVKMIWPANLCVLYPHPGTGIPFWQVAVSTGLFLLTTALAIHFARRTPYLAVGWLWYVVTLLPVIGLVQVGKQAIADRYTYIPLIGPFVALVWGAADLSARFSQRTRTTVTAAAAVLILAALTAVTIVQVGHWRTGVTLFEHAVRVVPDHYVTHYCLADAYMEEERPEDAIRALRRTLKLKYDLPPAHCVMGYALAGLGKNREGLAALRTAIRLDPKLAAAWNNIGGILLEQGKTDEALPYIRRALTLKPDYAQAHYNLANLYDGRGDAALAEKHYRSAIEANPRFAPGLAAMGAVLSRRGDLDGAERYLREAVRISPDTPEALMSLGAVLVGKGDHVEAYKYLSKAVELRPESGAAHYYLAVVLARMGSYEEARKEHERALDLGFRPAGQADGTTP